MARPSKEIFEEICPNTDVRHKWHIAAEGQEAGHRQNICIQCMNCGQMEFVDMLDIPDYKGWPTQ